LTVIEPRELVKGSLSGPLVLHQLGGTLPDGRFLKIWGQPEYVPGHEVLVFAVRREPAEYQTAEMLLGKFDVETDERGVAFAVPGRRGPLKGVSVYENLRQPAQAWEGPLSTDPPRGLDGMLRWLRAGAKSAPAPAVPQGRLSPVVHSIPGGPRLQPE